MEALSCILALLYPKDTCTRPPKTTWDQSFTLKSLVLSAELELLAGALGLQALQTSSQGNSDCVTLLHYQVR